MDGCWMLCISTRWMLQRQILRICDENFVKSNGCQLYLGCQLTTKVQLTGVKHSCPATADCSIVYICLIKTSFPVASSQLSMPLMDPGIYRPRRPLPAFLVLDISFDSIQTPSSQVASEQISLLASYL